VTSLTSNPALPPKDHPDPKAEITFFVRQFQPMDSFDPKIEKAELYIRHELITTKSVAALDQNQLF